LPRDPLTITRAVQPNHPFTVAGERAAILGEQSGDFEAWLFPVKVLSKIHLTAELKDYPVPIDVTAHAAAIEVAPAMTTITYSHAAFTVRQRMFAPRGDAQGLAVLFEIQSARPLTLTIAFRPDMQRMWPAPSFGTPNAEWVRQGAGGYYVLHTDNPELSVAVAMPHTKPGVLAPYQERPKTWPVELKLAFDPAADSASFFPLLITMLAPNAQPGSVLTALNERVPRMWQERSDYYAHFFDTRLTADTPDGNFDAALRWAELAIDEGKVRFHDETGLIAGYYESGDSARPGFAWFFGRDSLWTSYAINAYGDFELTRHILEFLIHRQRADGKIMHEFSQTADLVSWQTTPYFYAAADATPLFVMAMEDYVNASGDVSFLKANWNAVKNAHAFTRTHDSDADGIYENTEGTGWVESWPPGMPHQEVYLAALDQQSADSMSRLAALAGDPSLAQTARRTAGLIQSAIEKEYLEPTEHFYAFSRNADGTLDHTATIFPAVAWWSGRLSLPDSEPMLNRWASREFSTDWGTRDVSGRTPFFDPISYHQGSVWPLYTGWVSLAEYRGGHTLSAYAHLMQNADLSWAQDLGAVTELLSGEFFQPLGRSSSHQIWSSAMVVNPALRGLFGLDWDALRHTLRLAPHLPATWDHAQLRNVPLGDARVDLEFHREGAAMRVQAHSSANVCLALQSSPRGRDCGAGNTELLIPLPPVELELEHVLPLAGSETSRVKVVGQRISESTADFDFEGQGGSAFDCPIRLNRSGVRVTGATMTGNRLQLVFPAGANPQRVSVRFTY